MRDIRAFVERISRKILRQDEYNWKQYPEYYQAHLTDNPSGWTYVLSKDTYQIIDGKIMLNPMLPPLHPGCKLVYETIYHLSPKSILDVGCGCGDHIHNLNLLLPDAKLYGMDVSQNQIDFLFSRHPHLKNIGAITVKDITKKDVPSDFEKVDLVYMQTVLMHIKGNGYIRALKNIFDMSSNCIVLMENWASHNFFADIISLSKKRGFPWPELNIYYNDSGEWIIMVLSKEELKGFSILRNNKELLKYSEGGKNAILGK